MATFGERLLALRTERHITQQELADQMGLSRWSVLNYEQGKNKPDFDGLMLLADYFGVSLDYLTGRKDERG